MGLRKVITYGNFDAWHLGHYLLLKRARELGDHLTVGLSTDEFSQVKGKTTLFSYDERKKHLEMSGMVDAIIPENNWEQKSRDIKGNDINIFTIGDDWAGHFDDLPCEVIYLPRTPDISTSLIKERCTKE